MFDKEILVAKKRSSNYMISLDIKNPKTRGDHYVGKVKAWDKKKNTYFIFDYGENPENVTDKDRWRRTLAGVKFGSTVILNLSLINWDFKLFVYSTA